VISGMCSSVITLRIISIGHGDPAFNVLINRVFLKNKIKCIEKQKNKKTKTKKQKNKQSKKIKNKI
jgi:hypothetical protein